MWNVRDILSVFFYFNAVIFTVGCAGGVSLEALEAPSDASIEVTSDYPAVAKVILPGGFGLCTGTFVSPRTILTAAHCTLRSGTYTIVSSFGIFRSSEVQNFGPGVVDDPNDISIILLDEDVAEDSQILPIGPRPALLDRIRLVGFGCNEIERRTGAGVKRTGTNQVYRLGDYIELATPLNGGSQRGILGPANRAGSCFGDSGGPMLVESGGQLSVVGVAHAGSWNSSYSISYYADLNRWDNMDFLRDMDRVYDADVLSYCSEPGAGYDCNNQFSLINIFSFLKWLWVQFTGIL